MEQNNNLLSNSSNEIQNNNSEINVSSPSLKCEQLKSSLDAKTELENKKPKKKGKLINMKRYFKSTTEISNETETTTETNKKNRYFFRTLKPIKMFKAPITNIYESTQSSSNLNKEIIQATSANDNNIKNKRKRFKELFSITINKHFSHVRYSDKKFNKTNQPKDKFEGTTKQLLECSDNDVIDDLENLSLNLKPSQPAIHADCRSFEEKKDEINDVDLINFLAHRSSKVRRNATCERIDKFDNNKQLLNFMEYLLREDYIKNFLL